MLQDKNILLGVTGGIAIYKSVDLVSKLKKQGAHVKVVMTDAAEKFVTPLTFQTISENVVHNEMFDQLKNLDVEHISLAKWADVILLAPASANTIAKVRYGICDNMLTTVLLARRCPLVIAPAMNTVMYEAKETQDNLAYLAENGAYILETGSGLLACGDVGAGKMMEPVEIIEHLEYFLTEKTMAGKRVTITAGPTRERFDPVRYVTNYSSGKMGYSLAKEARNRGAKVNLISGPTQLSRPWGVEFYPVESTIDMFEAVEKVFDETDILIKSAAPSDFRPKEVKEEKIKKEGNDDGMTIELTSNPDIAKHFGAKKTHQFIVGFAAESHNLEENARKKLAKKNFDMIVANNILDEKAGFGKETNVATIFTAEGKEIKLPVLLKTELASEILNLVEESLES